MGVLGVQPVESRLHGPRDLVVARVHDLLVVGRLRPVGAPVERRQEFDGDRRRHREGWREDGGEAVGREEDGKDLDPEAMQAQHPGQSLTA
jgi:hypothetical protein